MASPSSLGNRRARRGSVSQNITHTAVGFMSSNGVLPSSPPAPSHPLRLSISFCPLLLQLQPTHLLAPHPPTPVSPRSPHSGAVLSQFVAPSSPPQKHCHHQLSNPSPPPSSPHTTTILAISEGLDKDLYSIIHIQGGEVGGGTRHAHKYRVTPRLKIQ